MTWRWPSRRIIEAVHHKLVQRHGGGHGLRDGELLESSLARPQNLAAYGDPSVFDLAANLAYGIAQNHPFVDGNKRAAFVAGALFLRLNGYSLDVDQAEAALIFYRLAAGELSEEELSDWYRRNAVEAAE